MSRIRGKASTDGRADADPVVGIDISKNWLDVCVHPGGPRLRFPNTAAGIDELCRECAGCSAELVVLEATGRYHRAAHRKLHEAGLNVAVVNPYRSRRFADVMGHLAKTDRIDAQVLAQFGSTMRPTATKPPTNTMADLTEIVVARRQIVEERIALEQQRSQASLDVVRDQITDRIELCRCQCRDLDALLLELVTSDSQIARRFKTLASISGVGPVTAATLLAEMKKLGSASAAEISALAGVAPINRDSGQFRGHLTIRGGRAVARKTLYMAALIGIRWNPDLRAGYEHLRNSGKPFKVVITAAMRKLLILANTLLKEHRFWLPAPP